MVGVVMLSPARLGRAAPAGRYVKRNENEGSDKMIVFDIETGPLPEETLRENWTLPTLDEFAQTCDKRWKPETVASKYEEAKGEMWNEYVAKAALSPLTGRVLASR